MVTAAFRESPTKSSLEGLSSDIPEIITEEVDVASSRGFYIDARKVEIDERDDSAEEDSVVIQMNKVLQFDRRKHSNPMDFSDEYEDFTSGD